ncbi:hypothetical protein DEU56DRAFT_44946 [Suillus clintonianus]|uniref:uncharacterized protein n=1 Tax=Suillus clintonianus TaxID=1904413 RepID=UPI001B871BE5|nr:uncharacterized protein DEU56DRAFT_44946 [Suillus clintonianus]KAG2123759.1 hypothetical protein DEU56DRAFT_44946 [Suillus clintonianus]
MLNSGFRVAHLLLAAMNIAGPSRPRLVPGPRERNNYEEDLTRMIARLEPSDVERWQALYDNCVHRGERLSDYDVAFALLMQDARDLAEFNADRALAQQLQGESGEPDPAPMSPNPAQAPTIMTRPAPPRATGHDCVICQDPIFGAEVRASCGHFYDIGCITDLFQSATRDESLYPPRCCRQNITLLQVRPHLTQAVLAEFELKAQEFGTTKRVYCVAPTCSRFLGPLHEGYGYFTKAFTCTSPTCMTKTCAKCRSRHEGFTHICTPDAEDEQVLALSRTSGWARCPGCAQMIELSMGCFHMTCRCRTEFCYLCKELWKNCRCPQWDEDRLLAAAERRVDAQLPPAQPANPLQQAPAVRQPVPAVGDVRNQPVNLPRPAPAPAPVANVRFENPFQVVPAPALGAAPVANIPFENPFQLVPAPALGAEPVANIWPTARRAEVFAPAPLLPVPLRPTILRPGAPAPAPLPEPHFLTGTRRVETYNRISGFFTNWTPERLTDESEVPEWHVRVEPALDGSAVRPFIREMLEDLRAATQRRLIRETMERLRVDHDCDHTDWTFRSGGGHCEACEMIFPLYLFRCRGCEMLACIRCLRNRL